MNQIKLEQGVKYHPRKLLSYSTLYILAQYCLNNNLRFCQTLWNILDKDNRGFWDTRESAFFYIEDDEVDQRIKEYISGKG